MSPWKMDPRRRASFGAAALCLLVGVGCAAAALPTPSSPELRASLEKAEIDFAAATSARGVDGWVAAFADDGVQLDAKGQVTRGKEQIRAKMTPVLGRVLLTWKPTLVDVAPGGETGFTYGLYEVRRRDGTPRVIARGSYMTVWRRDAAGEWKVVADMGSEDAEPQVPSPPPVASLPPPSPPAASLPPPPATPQCATPCAAGTVCKATMWGVQCVHPAEGSACGGPGAAGCPAPLQCMSLAGVGRDDRCWTPGRTAMP